MNTTVRDQLTRIAYDTPTAAAEVGLPPDSIVRAIRNGALPAKKSGRRTVIRREDLAAWIASLPDA